MAKLARQRAIVELIAQGSISSQEELQRALHRRSLRVGQATLSRDIHELGVIKTSTGYALAERTSTPEVSLPPISRLVREFVLEVRKAQNLLVVKTAVGSAQPVAAALDDENWPEVVGTVAGDDTILIVAPDKRAASKLAGRIREMLA